MATTTYLWKGRTPTGEVLSGEFAAESKQELINNLRKRKIIITTIRTKSKDLNLSFGLKNRINTRDLGVFTRQFATMINAGLPMVQCLDILSSQMDKPNFKKIVAEVMTDVEAGTTLADALHKHKCFSDLYVNMVEAGEAGGILDVILNRLAAYLEKVDALIKKVKGAMTYPAVVFTVCIGATIFMLLFIIPTFAQMFSDFGGELPLPTRIVMGLSNFLRMNWWLLVAVAVGGFIGIKRYYKTESGHYNIDKLMLRSPVIGPVIRKSAVARFTRTLGTLVSSGVPILSGLEITARTSGNKVIEEAVMKTRTSISEGNTIAEPLKECGVFPPMVVQMIGVGEQTGALDEMLDKVADFYDGEVDTAVDALTSIIEPIMIVVMGGIVGGMLIAMYLPMFKLVSVVAGGLLMHVFPRARFRLDAGSMNKLVFLRLVAATLTAGAAVVVLQCGESGAPMGALYGLLGVIYLTTGSMYLAARGGVSERTLVWGAIASDCAVLTLILHFSGGAASHFAVLFILPIIVGGMWFETSGGLGTAALAASAYIAYSVLEYGGRIVPHSLSIHAEGGNPLLRGYLLMAIFVSAGLLSGSYAARARRKSEELSRAEGELRRVQRNTDSIIANVSSGLIVTDMTGEIMTCNPAAERILGMHCEGGAVGRLVHDVIPHMSPLTRELESAIATGTPRHRHELEVRRADGSVLPLGMSISFLRGEQGERRGVVAIFQDLTDVHRMRDKVRSADKMAAIGELSTAIAHEIRAPLASICGSIEMLSQELDLSGDNRRLMELVIKESDRLDRIITDFLEFARLRPPQFEPVDVEDCLAEVLLLLRHSSGVGREVAIEVQENTPHACVFADDEQIRQVFLNLIMNACEAMGGRGRLAIRIDGVAKSLREEAESEQCVSIDFANNGPAIPPEALPRIFEPFFTTKEGGTGLGLAIVARIVDSHGGHVRAASAEGQGAVFTIVLPIHAGSDSVRREELEETFIGF